MFEFNVVYLVRDRFDLLNHSLAFFGARLAASVVRLSRTMEDKCEADLFLSFTQFVIVWPVQRKRSEYGIAPQLCRRPGTYGLRTGGMDRSCELLA